MLSIFAAALFLLAVVATPLRSARSADIVGIVTCSAYYTGPLAYVTDIQVKSKRADQYFYYIEVNEAGDLLVDPSASTGRLTTFETCNSTFMGFPASTETVHGHIRDVETGKCLFAAYKNSTDFTVELAPCYISDDSGQIQYYWTMSSAAPYEITFNDETYSTGGTYGKEAEPVPVSGEATVPLNISPGDHGFWLGLLEN